MYWLLYLCFAFSCFLCELGVRGAVTRVEWSPVGVKAVNHTVTVDIGDQLILMCPNGSYSNLIGLENQAQFNSCDSSDAVKDIQFRFRGFCYGATQQALGLDIEQASAKLPSDLGFVEGNITFLASFSTGANLSSANTDRTAGGECLDGLRLAVYVRDSSGSTNTVAPATSPLTTDTSSNVDTVSPSSQATSSQVQILPDITPLGISGSKGIMNYSLHSKMLLALSIFSCTLITLTLRTFS